MGRLHVQAWMLDDSGARRLDVEIDEPTRLDVDRDPLYVFGRLDAQLERARAQLHDQALRISARTAGTPGRVQ
jgi:hypothetical protein